MRRKLLEKFVFVVACFFIFFASSVQAVEGQQEAMNEEKIKEEATHFFQKVKRYKYFQEKERKQLFEIGESSVEIKNLANDMEENKSVGLFFVQKFIINVRDIF